VPLAGAQPSLEEGVNAVAVRWIAVTLVVTLLFTALAARAAGQVPMPFVVLVFWSCLLAHALALPVGILLGYRKR
jgi:hypothetical protein